MDSQRERPLSFLFAGGEPPNCAHAHARQKQKLVMLTQMNSLHMLTNSLHIQTNSLNVLATAGAQIVPGMRVSLVDVVDVGPTTMSELPYWPFRGGTR